MPIREEPKEEIKIPFSASKIENIDSAMISYLDEELNLHTTTNNGWSKVPVIWTSSERVFQSKRDSRIRDDAGSLVLPIISVERKGVAKDLQRKGSVQAALVPEFDEKGGTIKIARRIKQDKTSNFANASAKRKRGQLNFPTANKKIVYETLTIPLPIYITVQYEITIRTEYQQQMNDLITPFLTKPGGVHYILIKNESHRYEGFINQDFTHNNNISSFSNEERKFETKITIDVLGHLIGAGVNEDQPQFAIRENAVDFKMPRERIMTKDEVERKLSELYGLSGVEDIYYD